MGHHGASLRIGDIDERFGAQWDALPAGRRGQADIYDSWAWHAAWLRSDPRLARSLRVTAVLDGDRPAALLPLTVTRSGAWRSAGLDCRPRSRVVIGAEQPDPDVLCVLAETLARGGARALALHRLPSRDPATHELVAALRSAGYRVATRPRSADRLAPVAGGWAEHRRRFKSFAQYAKRFSGRIAPLWDLTMDTYSAGPEAPVADGFALFADLQARSWKGPYDRATFVLRAELLRRAELLGWARVFVLRIAGKPAAGHVWFRLGAVATWLSTAHDQALNALSPGTIMQWWAQEKIFPDPRDSSAEPLAVLDFLPGGSPQKDRLSPDRPPLLEIDAVRRSLVAGVALPARQEARRIVPAVRARARARRRAWRDGRTRQAAPAPPARRVVVAAGDQGWPAARLDVGDPAVRRYLAVAAGEPSPEATAEKWSAGDVWWRLGAGPAALARVSEGGEGAVATEGAEGAGEGAERIVREIVRLDPAVTAESVAAALATAYGRSVTLFAADASGSAAGPPVILCAPPLPWPAAWREALDTAGRP
jgi:hypothetical protein